MLSKELQEVLACPKCKGELEYNQKEEKLICHKCRLKFAIKDDIPIMLIDEAEKF
ncbi:MAG: Trm112 family protein [Calditrichaeota bacterium]|nr:Trm112 family protein [Calditrichota bacterium]